MEDIISRYLELRDLLIENKYIYYKRPKEANKYIKGISDAQYDRIEDEYNRLHNEHFPFEENYSKMVGFSLKHLPCRFAVMRVHVRNMSESKYIATRRAVLELNPDYDLEMFRI